MKNSNTGSNFGKWGWSTIIYCAISYYLAAALSTDTLNWTPSAFQGYRGWVDTFADTCNSVAGIAGWIGILGVIIFTIVTQKIGTKKIACFSGIITGIFCFVMAYTGSPKVFLFALAILTIVGGTIPLNIVPNNLMNIWFPKKKGIALGWASMGLPICTATIILIFNAIGNPTVCYTVLGIACIVVGLISLVWIKNTPEDVGATPDNEPINLEEAKKLKALQEAAADKITLGMIFKDRNTWVIGIGLGLLWMTTMGIVSNFVVRMIQTGVEQQVAIMFLTVAAIIGIIGSYIWGWLDQKIGTKGASIVYGVWYLVALILMILQNGSMVMVVLAAIFAGFGIGGIGNLIPSMIGTCFGRFGFLQANKVIAPLNSAVRSCALIIIGAVGTANLSKAYGIFFIGSVIAIVIICFAKPQREKYTVDSL